MNVNSKIMPGPLMTFTAKLSRFFWVRMPKKFTDLEFLRPLGHFFYNRFTYFQSRDQTHSTWFLRNVPQANVLANLIQHDFETGSSVRMASIGCSTGAELYSLLYIVKSHCPNLKFISQGVDICPGVVEIARKAIYNMNEHSATKVSTYSVGPREVASLTSQSRAALFENEKDNDVQVKEWIRSDTTWHSLSADDPALLGLIGTQDIVLAKNFLGPMDDNLAVNCLLNIIQLVRPGGYLVVDGIDLNLKARILPQLNVTPITDQLKEIYYEDITKEGWPWVRWAHEPMDLRRADWKYRYCSIFRVS